MRADLRSAELSEVIVEIDSQVRFSWTLLGRAPHSVKELLTVYAAVLAHGTDLSLAAVKLLMPGVAPDSVATTMKALESQSRLRRANSAVVEFLRRHPIADIWGDGTAASADAGLLATRVQKNTSSCPAAVASSRGWS